MRACVLTQKSEEGPASSASLLAMPMLGKLVDSTNHVFGELHNGVECCYRELHEKTWCLVGITTQEFMQQRETFLYCVIFPLAINHRYEIGVGNTYMSVLRNSQMIYHRGGEPERAMHCWFNVMAHKPWITAEFVTVCCSMSVVSNTSCYTHTLTILHTEVMS